MMGAAVGVTGGVAADVAKDQIMGPSDHEKLTEKLLHAIATLDKLQRERLMFMVNIGPGTNWETHVRIRASHILFSVDGAVPNRHFALQTSTSTLFDWYTGTLGGVQTIEIPILLDNGKSIKVVDLITPAAVDYAAYLLGYTE